MSIRAVSSLDLKGKKILLRCDFNVPLKDGKIADSHRIDASLPTIRYVLENGGAAVLCSHLGRPKGPQEGLSLRPVAQFLSEKLGSEVKLAPDCVGEATDKMVESLASGHALLLENLRFHSEEEANDPAFAQALARGKDVYVNDAFGTAHRAHASTAGVASFIAEKAAGMLMMREIEALRAVTQNATHPYVLVVGGAKVSDKIGLLRNMVPKVDTILIGGAMAYTFLCAGGVGIGKSRCEPDKLGVARELLAETQNKQVAVVLPVDHIVASSAEEGASAATVTAIPSDKIALDIGPRTIADFKAIIKNAKTIVWNGPLGYFEIPAFAAGTLKVGEGIALSGATTVLAGGDTEAAVANQDWASRFTHISTGGGAALEFLEGRELPGVLALEQKSRAAPRAGAFKVNGS
jgi:phosphoglycerate kinase